MLHRNQANTGFITNFQGYANPRTHPFGRVAKAFDLETSCHLAGHIIEKQRLQMINNPLRWRFGQQFFTLTFDIKRVFINVNPLHHISMHGIVDKAIKRINR